MYAMKLRMVNLLLLIVMVAAILAACGAPPAATSETPAAGGASATEAPAADTSAGSGDMSNLPEVPRNRTLIIMAGPNGQYPLFNNQNPFVASQGDAFHQGTLPATKEPLIMFTVLTGEYEPWLATSWEYNADNTEITLHLRDGVKWSDGQPFTADDVVFTMNMLRDNADKLTHLADLPTYLKEAVKVDDMTVKIVLKSANPAYWATTLTTNHGPVMLPAHIWKDQDPTTFTDFDIAKGWPVGTGPYKLVFASPQQKVYDLRKDWWAAATGFKPLPKVERIIYLPSQDESQAAQLIIQNQVDMSPILQVSTLKTVFAQNPKVITYSGQDSPYGYLDWCPIDLNMNDDVAPYNDKDIRWAISSAIDRDKLVALAESGAGVPALHQFTPYAWFKPFDDALKPIFAKYNYSTKADTANTDKIMQSKGYTKNSDGLWVDSAGKTFAMSMYVPSWLLGYGPPLTQQLRDAGFDATFDPSPGLDSAVQTGEQVLSVGCKGPSGVLGMDPYFMLAVYSGDYYRPTGQPAPIAWATSRWQNKDYDALVKQIAPLKADDPKTMDIFTKAMDIWVSEMPDIYLGQLIIRYPMSTEYWTGWPDQKNPYGFPHSWQEELEKTFINLQPTQ
jgi:peptide/nickel transport system substrate-binding protein